jgi:hypothetical protein
MKFALGMLTAIFLVAIAVGINPMISAELWCAITQNERCF